MRCTTIATLSLFHFILALWDATESAYAAIDCFKDGSNPECRSIYTDINSCFDYLMAGQRKPGFYPFLKSTLAKNEFESVWCQFSDDGTNATTIVHNALEAYDLRIGHGFQVISEGQKRAWDVQYGLEPGKLHELEQTSALCLQEVFFNNCSSYEKLQSALKEKRAIILSGKDEFMTEKDFEQPLECRSGSIHAVPLSSAVVAVGFDGTNPQDQDAQVRLSLGPLVCYGKKLDGRVCGRDLTKDVKPEEVNRTFQVLDSNAAFHLSFHFRTLFNNVPLLNVNTSNGQMKISIERGWLFRIIWQELGMDEEPLQLSPLSDGYWHKVQLSLTDRKLRLVVDMAVFTWNLATSPGRFKDVIFDPKFIGCVSGLKINGEDRCSNGQNDRFPSSCDELRVCNPDGNVPCTDRNGCSCQCPLNAGECKNLGDPEHTATFLQSGGTRHFIWIDNDGVANRSAATSFFFKTDQDTALLAYLILPDDHSSRFVQIAMHNKSFIEAHYCHTRNFMLNCSSCYVHREKGYNDLSWHYVSFEERRSSRAASGRMFLFTSERSCQLQGQVQFTVPKSKVHVAKALDQGKSAYMSFLGGVPPRDEQFLAMTGYKGFFDTKGPPSLVGCIYWIGHDRTPDYHPVVNANSHASRRFRTLKDYLLETRNAHLLAKDIYNVTPGCSFGDCSSCGEGIPCILDVGDRPNCDCSSDFLVQKDTQHPDTCQAPKSITWNGYTNGPEQCVIALKAPINAPVLNKRRNLELYLLWFTFQVINPASTFTHAKTDLFKFTHGSDELLLANLRTLSNIQIALDNGGHYQLTFERDLSNSSIQNIFILRRLDKYNYEIQVNNKRARLLNDHLFHFLDRSFIAEFSRVICISSFVVQYRQSSTDSTNAPAIVEVDIMRNVSDILQLTRHTAAVRDFSVLYGEVPLMNLVETSYPPGMKIQSANGQPSGSSDSSPYWIIGIVIGVIALILIAAGLVIYFGSRNRRRRRHHGVVTTDDFDEPVWQENGGGKKKKRSTQQRDEKQRRNNLSLIQQPKSDADVGQTLVAKTPTVTSGVPKSNNERSFPRPLIKPSSRMPTIDDEDGKVE